MCGLVPHIYKSKISKKWHFVLKYSDLESCIVNTSGKKVYINVRFNPFFRFDSYDRASLSWPRTLVTVQFNPQRSRRDFFWTPWRKEQSPLVVNASIYAIPNDLARKIGFTQRILRWLMIRAFAEIAAHGLFTCEWHFQANLYASHSILECEWYARKGVKIVGFKRTSISLLQSIAGGSHFEREVRLKPS